LTIRLRITSAAFHGLVVGTTQGGTAAGLRHAVRGTCLGRQPGGDLYKTQLAQLAAHWACPDAILHKLPSGDLWVGQTTRANWAFSYAEGQPLLVLLVDRRWQRSELIEAGFDAAFVDRVAEMVRRNQYKRRMPVIAKLSHRTVDRDFRYARDWGT